MTSNTNATNSAGAGAKPEPRLAETPPSAPPRESGGPKGPEPTRYGDWERKGKCVDF